MTEEIKCSCCGVNVLEEPCKRDRRTAQVPQEGYKTNYKPPMNEERLEHLWKFLSSATNIDHLEYEEAVTIGGVFGDMKEEILRLQDVVRYLSENK